MQCLWTVQCNHIFVTLTKVKQIYWDFIYHKCKYWFDIIQIIIFNFIPTIYNLHTYENHWFMLGPDQNAVLFYFAQFFKRFDEFLHSVNCSGCSIVFFIDEKKNNNNNSTCSDVVCSNLINNIHISSAMYMYRLCLCY